MEDEMCKQFIIRPFAGEEVVQTFEMYFEGQRITPGDVIRLKESSTEYRFVSLETAISSGVTWMNVRDLKDNFKLKQFHPGKVRGLVRKRSFGGR